MNCELCLTGLTINFIFSFDFRWLPIAAMRPVGPESLHSECVLVVGVSRPKLAALFLTVMLISLFLTFHVLYDSAVYSIQVSAVRKRLIYVKCGNVVNLIGSKPFPGCINCIRKPNIYINKSIKQFGTVASSDCFSE